LIFFQPHILPSVWPWIRGGHFYFSGDGNPANDTHGTFFAVLSTPRVYARFPFFNEMNNRDLFADLMLRPGKNPVLRTDVHGLWLVNSHDLWCTGGGAYQPWTFGFSGRPSNGSTAFADRYNMSADYKFTHGVTLGLYFCYAEGRAVIEKIYPGNSNGLLGFTEVNYRF
jgi:hypothetical protein